MRDTSEVLLEGMQTALSNWGEKLNGEQQELYWLLRLQMAEHGFIAEEVEGVMAQIPTELRTVMLARFRRAAEYWDDIRYASLEPVTQIWGTIVNSVRVAANSDRATEVQSEVFSFAPESLVVFFRAVRERMEVADALHSTFRSMPAPECQALAALLNVHVEGRLDPEVMGRLVRLLDHEGPMSAEEQEVLASLSSAKLVNAAFSGLRANA